MRKTDGSAAAPTASPRYFRIGIGVVFLLGACGVGFGANSDSARPVPEVKGRFGSIPQRFQNYDVILKPDKDEPEWWAGAPSVVRDPNGSFWLACRMRTAEAPRGLRGYEIRILRSEDGIHFRKAHSILRQDIPIPGFERPSLLIDPQTRRFKLYACGPWKQGPWCIIKFADANDPTRFEPSSAKVVSTTPDEHFYTWRYSPWMYVDGQVWVYAEVARPNGSNEIRLFRLHR